MAKPNQKELAATCLDLEKACLGDNPYLTAQRERSETERAQLLAKWFSEINRGLYANPLITIKRMYLDGRLSATEVKQIVAAIREKYQLHWVLA